MNLLSIVLALYYCCVPMWTLSIPYLEPEKISRVEVRACTVNTIGYKNSVNDVGERDNVGHYIGLPDIKDIKWCLKIETNKDSHDFLRMKTKMTQYRSMVDVKWYKFGNKNKVCSIGLIGHKGQYRLSPDVGYYNECEQDIAKYRRKLASGSLTEQYRAIFNPNCPIRTLPRKNEDYLACTLESNVWYKLEFKSAIFAEQQVDFSYVVSWANHTESRMFRPTALTVTQDNDWYQYLIKVKINHIGCRVRILLIQSDMWPHELFVNILKHTQKSMSDQPRISPILTYARLNDLKPWFYFDLRIKNQNTTVIQELCLNMTSNNTVLTTEKLYCIDLQSETCSSARIYITFTMVLCAVLLAFIV